MSLQDEISLRASQIYRESYQMSIGELINLYKDGELDILSFSESSVGAITKKQN